MVWCSHCGKNVSGLRPYDGALACNLCGRILENYNYSNDVQFVKNAAGQSQASGNIVSSVQSGVSSSRQRRFRIARDELSNLTVALIGDERDDLVDFAAQFFEMAAEQNFTKGRRTELVQCSCLYLTCREKKLPFLLIDFSSYLRVSVYELGSVYLQLCELLYIVKDKNYEELVDPSIFIPRFSYILLKGGTEEKAVVKTARDIIASMKRDWMQTGRKPSGICGAALYVAALCHGVKCSKSDIVKIVHICEATLTKRLIEFEHTEAASLTVDELGERERVLEKSSSTPPPNSNKGTGLLCKHKGQDPSAYGLCKSCYEDFVTVSGGLVGGSDPPAFQRAEKERMEKEAAARDENEGEFGSLNQVNVGEKPFSEKGQGEKYWDDGEASDESGNLSDVDDSEVDDIFLTEEEKLLKTTVFDLENKDYFEKQAAKAFMASNASNADSPDYARKLVEAVKKARKEKQQKRAEEAKNAPPPATAVEAVGRMLEKKRISGQINYDILEELFDTSPSPKRSKINTDMEEADMEGEEGSEHEDTDE
ncbi:unnamed protein product [Microthlaspi erraticum]|uniref:Cyclin-like domain-containing protein n=1 Tax=Microthlaspi erraticum TaxID=1685480 RepID=A0A6D2HB24_9BRAS|nr:unnamed protein product [Microthlaspi erraticum]